MTIVGCDFHPAWQQVAVFDSATGEIQELKLENGNGEADRFYRDKVWSAKARPGN
jgi:transposase